MIKDFVEYREVHAWMHKNYTKTGVCEHCGISGKTHWSNKTAQYLKERDDWQELCPKCHSHYDRKVLKATGIPSRDTSLKPIYISVERHEQLKRVAQEEGRRISVTIELLVEAVTSGEWTLVRKDEFEYLQNQNKKLSRIDLEGLYKNAQDSLLLTQQALEAQRKDN